MKGKQFEASDHESRKLGIGATESSIILGLNKYISAVDLWAVKTGKKEREDLSDNPKVNIGLYFEEPARQFIKKFHEPKIVADEKTYWANDFMFCHTDGDILDSDIIPEIKMSNSEMLRYFGKEDTDEVYEPYLIQCHHILTCRPEKKFVHLYLFVGTVYKRFIIKRDEELSALIIQKNREFWEHVVNETPPEPVTEEDVAIIYNKPKKDSIVVADPQIEIRQRQYKEAKKMVQSYENIQKQCAKDIKMYLGDHSKLVDSKNNTLATWNQQSRSNFSKKDMELDHPELVSKYIKTTSFRVLRVS